MQLKNIISLFYNLRQVVIEFVNQKMRNKVRVGNSCASVFI